MNRTRSRKLGRYTEPDSPRWAKAGGLRTLVYSNSLVLLMTTIWLASWFAQLVTGRIQFNPEQLDHHQAPLTLLSVYR